MIPSIVTLLIGLFLVLVLVPLLARFVAEPLGLVDRPDNNRKLHKDAIPLVGGISVYFASVVAILIALGWHFLGIEENAAGLLRLRPEDLTEFLGLFLGASFVLLVGIVDDSRGIRGRQKLLGQIIAITILVAFGFGFEGVKMLGGRIEFGHFSVLIVYAWMLVAINSINLLDGADGFASTIGIVLSIALAIMSFTQQAYLDAALSLALAGALIGFMRFNFPPAKVYLGDAGSMLIGFTLGALAIRCNFTKETTYSFFAPIALLAIPLIDTCGAIVRRRLTGRSIYSVDRGHIHHTMAKRGFSPSVSLLWVMALCLTTSAGAICSFVYRQSEYALVSIVIVMVVMFLGRIFGVAELQLLWRRASTMGKSMLTPESKKKDKVHQSTVQLQGNRDWQDAWQQISEFADEHELNEVTFDLNLPWIHESFHGHRKRADANRGENQEWYVELPVVTDGRIFGRIEIKASLDNRLSSHDIISNLLKLTSQIEVSLSETAANSSVEMAAETLEKQNNRKSENGQKSRLEDEQESGMDDEPTTENPAPVT